MATKQDIDEMLENSYLTNDQKQCLLIDYWYELCTNNETELAEYVKQKIQELHL